MKESLPDLIERANAEVAARHGSKVAAFNAEAAIAQLVARVEALERQVAAHATLDNTRLLMASQDPYDALVCEKCGKAGRKEGAASIESAYCLDCV